MKKSNKIGLKKRTALSLHRLYRKNETKLHLLKYLFWECTLRCNLNCIHCGSDCTVNNTVPDMPLSDFLKVIDEITPTVVPNTTMIVLTGGEPLMRKDLELCGNELYKRGFPWGTVSNGFLLNKKKLDSLLNAGLRALTISLDGFEDDHDWLRGRSSSYKRAKAAVQYAAEINDLEFDVVTCVNQRNISSLNEFKESLIDWEVKNWRLFTVFPIGRASENELLQLSDDQFKHVFNFIKDTRKEGRININYGCEGFLGSYEGAVRDELFFCRAGINVGSVLADGSISACPSLRENFIQGNIYKDNFTDVWENSFQIMRDRSWTKTGICKDCDQYKNCLGNGLHLRNPKSEDPLICHYRKLN